MKIPIVIGDEVESLWDDRTRPLWDAIGDYQIERASHVDPVPPMRWYHYLAFGPRWRQRMRERRLAAGHFAIYWKGRYRSVMGRVTYVDATGAPFLDYGVAVAYEVFLLKTRWYRIPHVET